MGPYGSADGPISFLDRTCPMSISQLSITNLRNIASLKLELAPQTNLFYGPNGSR